MISRKLLISFLAKGCVPARLIRDNKITYGALFVDDEGDVCEREVLMSGKVYHDAVNDAALPAVGDWVALELANDADDENMIRARLPRQTCFSRKLPWQKCRRAGDRGKCHRGGGGD